ncbi:MAG: hypothetical protein Q4F28_09865 [Eubacteriales bacterium]|nr:hypothetical protein [Eubacteriales bacterium]
MIDLNQAVRCETAGHSSKGNQLKWRLGDYWYKADYMGYEGLAEVVVSRLLARCRARRDGNCGDGCEVRRDVDCGDRCEVRRDAADCGDRSELAYDEDCGVPGLVEYEPVRIAYRESVFRGCKSRNFLHPEEELVTVDRLLRQYTGRSVSTELGRITQVKERIQYLVENVTEITGLRNFGGYLTAALEMDAVFLNEDRHVNNIAVIYRGEQEGYRLCPYFDYGLSLYADTTVDFKLGVPLEECRRRIEAKPFCRDFDEQLDAAEELYGKQLRFGFDERDIWQELEKLQGVYEEAELRRVGQVLNWQRGKYGYLF